jgi:hypothetical protein
MGLGAAKGFSALGSDSSFLAKARAFPKGHNHEEPLPITLEFTLPADAAEPAWDRARQWIRRYGGRQLRTLTATLIETHDPPAIRYRTTGPFGPSQGPPGTFFYSVERVNREDGVTFILKCAPGDLVVESDFWNPGDPKMLDFAKRYRRRNYDPLADRNAHTLAWFMTEGELYSPRIYPHGPFRTFGPLDPNTLRE